MSYEIIYSDELAHHGILGMKWGIRRYQNPDGSLTDAGKKRYSEDYNEYENLKNKKTSAMSNDELKKVTERMELEKKYKEYISSGNDYMKKVLAESAGKTLANVATTTAIVAGLAFLAKHYNINAKSITKWLVNLVGDVSTTVAKETAKGVSNVASSAGQAVKQASDKAGRSYVNAVDSIIGESAGRAYVHAVDNILNTVKRRRR